MVGIFQILMNILFLMKYYLPSKFLIYFIDIVEGLVKNDNEECAVLRMYGINDKGNSVMCHIH